MSLSSSSLSAITFARTASAAYGPLKFTSHYTPAVVKGERMGNIFEGEER